MVIAGDYSDSLRSQIVTSSFGHGEFAKAFNNLSNVQQLVAKILSGQNISIIQEVVI